MNELSLKRNKTIIKLLTALSFLIFVAYQLFLVTKIETGRPGRILGVVFFSLITAASFLALANNSVVKVIHMLLLTFGLAATLIAKMFNAVGIFGMLDFNNIPTVLRCGIYVFAQVGTLILLIYYLAIRRNQKISYKAKRVVTVTMMLAVIFLFVASLIMELVLILKYRVSITYNLSSTVVSRFFYCFAFVGTAIGLMLPTTKEEDEDLAHYINKEQSDADIMVMSPENKKPREEEARRRNLVIDNADIVMGTEQSNRQSRNKDRRRNAAFDDADVMVFSPKNDNPREEEARRRNLVIDDADIVMGAPQTGKSRSNKGRNRNTAYDDDGFVFSTPENNTSNSKKN